MQTEQMAIDLRLSGTSSWKAGIDSDILFQGKNMGMGSFVPFK